MNSGRLRWMISVFRRPIDRFVPCLLMLFCSLFSARVCWEVAYIERCIEANRVVMGIHIIYGRRFRHEMRHLS